jgi:DNA-binding NarL/FixJ family response regulator
VIRVAVADDQSLIRVGLRTIFAAEDDIELVGEASDGREALQLVREQHPDVVLMDIRMPHYDGLAALRDICSDPDLDTVRVIMLTTFELDEYVFEALRSGASGFLLKDADPEELLRAIRVVADGGALLAPSVTRRVVEEFAGRSTGATDAATSAHPDIDRLTDREREILAWVATGRSNDEIAAELVVSPATVRTHVGRAMVKLQARDRAQLVVFAVQSGLTGDQL